jgi:hypothetical protein
MSATDLIIPTMLAADFLVLPAAAHQEKHRSPLWAAIYTISYVVLIHLTVTHDLGDLLLIGAGRFLIGVFRLPGVWARFINWEWKKAQPVCDRKLMFGMGWAMQAAINYWAVLR